MFIHLIIPLTSDSITQNLPINVL